MKSIIQLSEQSYLIHWSCQTDCSKKTAVLIVPRTAECFANLDEAFEAKDGYAEDLSKEMHVYKVILPGQDLASRREYSFNNSVWAAEEAELMINNGKDRELKLVIGICTGGCIAIESLRKTEHVLPIMMINSSAWVPWATEAGQKKFKEKYKTRLNGQALMSAPMPKDIVKKYPGKKILQVLCGDPSSDYKLEGKPGREGQKELILYNPDIEQWLVPDFGNAPNPASPHYPELLKRTFMLAGI